MPLSAEELAQLDDVINARVQAGIAAAGVAPPGPVTNDEAQNQPENQPDFYLHLSDGSVIQSKNTGSHVTNDAGETLMVIGRFPVDPSAKTAQAQPPAGQEYALASYPTQPRQPNSGTPEFPAFT